MTTNYFPDAEPREYTYKKFVEAVTRHRDELLAMENEDLRADSAPFRRWKIGLEDAVTKIKRTGYKDIRCEILTRSFTSPNDRLANKVFEKQATDTLIEIEQLIKNYEEDGPPPRPYMAPKTSEAVTTAAVVTPKAADDAVPAWPTDAGVYWYAKHVPMRILSGLGAFVAAAVALAFWFGGIYNEWNFRRPVLQSDVMPAPAKLAPLPAFKPASR